MTGSTGPHGSPSAPQTILITGASSGIGLATAHQAAEAGARLALLARSAEPLQRTAAECRALGAAEVLVLPVDVSNQQAVRTAVTTAVDTLGPLDLVVHAAGVAAFGDFLSVPAEVFDRVVTTNVIGAANLARAVLPGMRERNTGVLVLLGSLEGHMTPPFMGAYAASKWAVRSLARTLHLENRDRSGVHVCWLAPAGVDTPIYAEAANYSGRAERPPPPVYRPEQVASAALRLARFPRRSVQVGVFNRIIEAGYLFLPGVYDRLVTPLFKLVITKRTPQPAGPGNVFDAPADDAHRLHG